MEKQNLLDSAECQVGYLENSVIMLRLLTDDLTHELIAWNAGQANGPINWAIERCSGLFVLLRELERIQADLAAAVAQEYQEMHTQKYGGKKTC